MPLIFLIKYRVSLSGSGLAIILVYLFYLCLSLGIKIHCSQNIW